MKPTARKYVGWWNVLFGLLVWAAGRSQGGQQMDHSLFVFVNLQIAHIMMGESGQQVTN